MKYHTVRVPRNLGPFFFCHRTGNPRRTDRQWRPRGIGGIIFEPSSDLENLELNFRKKHLGENTWESVNQLSVTFIKQGRRKVLKPGGAQYLWVMKIGKMIGGLCIFFLKNRRCMYTLGTLSFANPVGLTCKEKKTS